MALFVPDACLAIESSRIAYHIYSNHLAFVEFASPTWPGLSPSRSDRHLIVIDPPVSCSVSSSLTPYSHYFDYHFPFPRPLSLSADAMKFPFRIVIFFLFLASSLSHPQRNYQQQSSQYPVSTEYRGKDLGFSVKCSSCTMAIFVTA